jgi:hypothetical protein
MSAKQFWMMCLGTDHLTWSGGYGFLFRSEFFFRTTRELEYLFFFVAKFFPEFNIRLYDKISESDYFFFTTFLWSTHCHVAWTVNKILNRNGGYGFFSKKIFWFPILLKKIFWFWWRKKKIIWFRDFVI